LKADRWIHQHNTDVEEMERVWKEAEDLKRLEEKKKAEIEEDRRWREEGQRAEEEKVQRESEW